MELNSTVIFEKNHDALLGDKRFIINQMVVDLTTGETDFELITDYREIDNSNTIGYRFSSSDSVLLDNKAQSYQMTVYKNEYDSFSVTGDKSFLTFPDAPDQIQDYTFNIDVEENITENDRVTYVDIDYVLNGITTTINLPITQKL